MKSIYILQVALGMLIVPLIGCTSETNRFALTLKEKVAQSSKSPREVDLASVTAFSWDRLYIFGPYTPPGMINATLGYDWPEASRTGIEVSDGFNLFVFERSNKVVKYFKIPRLIDFEGIQYPFRCTRDAASFSVRVDDSNSERIILRPLAR
jgi:hypothetical protein